MHVMQSKFWVYEWSLQPSSKIKLWVSTLPVPVFSKREEFCESCQLRKCKWLSFYNSNRSSKFPLELIHSDVWKSPISSMNDCRYYVVFIDNFSRYSWLYPMHHKSDVFNCFVNFKCLVENLFSRHIKQFQSDGEENIVPNFLNLSCKKVAFFFENHVPIPHLKMVLLKEN